MRKDPTEFRKRFLRWKLGDTVYEAGLPKLGDGNIKKFAEDGDVINVEGYPLVRPNSVGLTKWFEDNPSVAGMAIGAGLNGVEGERRVVLNQALKDLDARNSVYQNESYRHFFDANSTPLPPITDAQREAYIGTPYEGLDRRIQETEAARYLSGDPSHHLNKEQKAQLSKFRFVYPGGTLPEVQVQYNSRQSETTKDSLFVLNLKKNKGLLWKLPKFVDGTGGKSYGYLTEDKHPIKFDEQGNLVDLVTGDIGTMRLPEVQVFAAPKKLAMKNILNNVFTMSNDATSIANGRHQNRHLEMRAVEGAKAHAAWDKEHPNLTAWGNVLGAVPFAVATYPLAAIAGSGITALGDAAAATSAGQAITAGLAPLATAASTSIAGTPLYTWADVGLSSLFGGHGVQTAIDEKGISPMTAFEVTPLGRMAKPMWNAGKEGLQYAAKATDNIARYMSPSYDLYRTIGETTPRTTPTLHTFNTKDLTEIGYNVHTGSPIFEFGQTMRTSPEKAYFMRTPNDVDILKLGNGRFRHEVVGNTIIPSGEVNGKFVSYGEPWKEFALGENSALYEFPVGPRRGPSLMATDWKGRPQNYSVDEIYDYMLKENNLREGFHKDVVVQGLDKLKGVDRVKAYEALKQEKYPELLQRYNTSIYGANQTVIPNERWNFDKFLKTPFWKYTENPISGQVQKELMMRWPEAKSLEAPTIEYAGRTAPEITAENAANYHGIMADAEDFSYKGLTSTFEKMMYNNKIHGKPMFPSDEGVGGFSKSVQVGIPKAEYNELLHDVIGRNIREFKRAGLSDAQVSNYINNAKDAMDNVHIGMYSDSDYIKGGWEGFGGFYDKKGNFISVNTGSPLTKTKVVKHEGRHLLDNKVDDEILMPTSEENYGKDFDSDMAASTMQKVKQNQNIILQDAYDNDFVALPKKEGYNEGLEGYANMEREAITTNLDARNELLGNKADWDLDVTDKIIDKMPDTAIFEAVEKANGYGRRYIRFLRDNNKLTPKKAKQFREAMKHVGVVAAPIGKFGYDEYVRKNKKVSIPTLK